jgi:hypothetical protein
MKAHFLPPVVGALAIALMCTTAHANLIANGSFETPSVPTGGFINFGTGSTSITGWTVVGPQASIVSGSYTSLGLRFPAEDGNQWLDLTGDLSNRSEGVRQAVATTAGTSYDLSFWVGNQVDPSGFYGATSTVNLSINGGPNLAFTNSGGSGTTSQNWREFTTSFIASSASTTLQFLNGDPLTDNTNGLDNIVLLEGSPSSGGGGTSTGTGGGTPTAVPEPFTPALLGIGLIAVAASRRRKSR